MGAAVHNNQYNCILFATSRARRTGQIVQQTLYCEPEKYHTHIVISDYIIRIVVITVIVTITVETNCFENPKIV